MRRIKGRPVAPEPTQEAATVEHERNEQMADAAYGIDPEMTGQSMFQNPDSLGMVKHYTEEEVIPEDVKEHWEFFTKALPLTFLEKGVDLDILDARLHIAKIDMLMSLPSYEITQEMLTKFDKIETHAWIQAMRAVGADRFRINERTLHQSQFAQRITTGQNPREGRKRGGVFGFLGF